MRRSHTDPWEELCLHARRRPHAGDAGPIITQVDSPHLLRVDTPHPEEAEVPVIAPNKPNRLAYEA
ncbi:hypothetical protein GCM10010399_57580 [Dactylosporangium fulvum]